MSICCLWKWNKVKVKSLSPVWLFATPWTVTYEAPPSMGFSRQECWVDCHFLLQGIFPTQELNPGLLHCRQTLYRLSHQGSRCLWPLYQIVTVNLPWHSLSFSSVNSIWLLAHQEYLFFFQILYFSILEFPLILYPIFLQRFSIYILTLNILYLLHTRWSSWLFFKYCLLLPMSVPSWPLVTDLFQWHYYVTVLVICMLCNFGVYPWHYKC